MNAEWWGKLATIVAIGVVVIVFVARVVTSWRGRRARARAWLAQQRALGREVSRR